MVEFVTPEGCCDLPPKERGGKNDRGSGKGRQVVVAHADDGVIRKCDGERLETFRLFSRMMKYKNSTAGC